MRELLAAYEALYERQYHEKLPFYQRELIGTLPRFDSSGSRTLSDQELPNTSLRSSKSINSSIEKSRLIPNLNKGDEFQHDAEMNKIEPTKSDTIIPETKITTGESMLPTKGNFATVASDNIIVSGATLTSRTATSSTASILPSTTTEKKTTEIIVSSSTTFKPQEETLTSRKENVTTSIATSSTPKMTTIQKTTTTVISLPKETTTTTLINIPNESRKIADERRHSVLQISEPRIRQQNQVQPMMDIKVDQNKKSEIFSMENRRLPVEHPSVPMGVRNQKRGRKLVTDTTVATTTVPSTSSPPHVNRRQPPVRMPLKPTIHPQTRLMVHNRVVVNRLPVVSTTTTSQRRPLQRATVSNRAVNSNMVQNHNRPKNQQRMTVREIAVVPTTVMPRDNSRDIIVPSLIIIQNGKVVQLSEQQKKDLSLVLSAMNNSHHEEQVRRRPAMRQKNRAERPKSRG
uniref:Uncharacterized protein n=1 Tax=Heterorhabditis bacteriophora TaxID=37862 RepID=A0A1I7XDM5_HETBA